jgi:hypothetical protein
VPGEFLPATPANVYWQIPKIPASNGVAFNPTLFVCQTTALVKDLNSTNTWPVAQVPSKCSSLSLWLSTLIWQGNCGECVVKGGVIQNNTITFTLVGYVPSTTGTKFFICISNAPEYINRLVCDSYSSFFGIVGITAAVPRKVRSPIEQQESTPTLTNVSSMPTTPFINYTIH